MADLTLYRKLANTYQVESSEQNAINEFGKQSNKIWDATLSTYDLLAPTKRGDDIVIVDYDNNRTSSRSVFNYNRGFSQKTMELGQQRAFFEKDSVQAGYYIERVDTNETFIIQTITDDKFLFEDTYVRKCNVDLKFVDSNGVIQTVPSSLIGKATNNDLVEGKYMTLTDGELSGMVQANSVTGEFNEGLEFIFGNVGKCKYRISFLNDFQTSGLLVINLERYEINPQKDNLELGIANWEDRPRFTLETSVSSSQISIGDNLQVGHTLLDKDGLISDKSIIYSSSDETIATVSGTGEITGVANGSCVIRVSMENNIDVFDEIALEVTATPVDNFTYELTPDVNTIFRLSNILFDVQEQNNSQDVIGETYTFAIAKNVSDDSKVVFSVVDGDSFRIENKGISGSVDVTITPTGKPANQFVKTFNISGSYG